jgi:FHS family L-fucose permease-like MFS transporter
MGSLIADVTKAKIADATPALMIALGVFVFALVVLLLVRIPEPDDARGDEAMRRKGDEGYSAFSFRHFKLGMLAIFMYLGIEVGVPTYIMQYLTTSREVATPGLGINPNIVGMIVAVYWLLMLVGRLLGGLVAEKVSSRTQIAVVSILTILLVTVGICLPEEWMIEMPGVDWASLTFITAEIPVAVVALILVGLCTSVMWGGIFNMAVEGLGRYTSIASGAFMTMVCGGGILIPLQGVVADALGSFRMSYVVVLGCAAYILFYALYGSKNVNKNIPI